jgi:ABC-type phosphate transport system substrate-binding protein
MGARAALFGGMVVLLVATIARPADTSIAVIVHPSRQVTLDADDVARIFLRKRRFWEDGSPIVPLNREASSAVRELFTRRVFGVSSAALSVYWNEQYVLGTLPPTTLASNEAVKRYVASEPNAIGYIEASLVDKSVRVALLLDGG